VTLIIIAYEIAYVLMPLFVLPMINLFGRKRCVLIGFSIDAICSVLFAMTDYFTAGQSREFLACAVAIRFVIGGAAALNRTPCGALLIEAAGKDRLEAVTGIYMACEGCGVILGPMIYATLFDLYGFQRTLLIQAI
jgi:MFS family permease